MINNKNFKLTFFAVFMAIELFMVKKTYYGLIRFRSVLNTPAFINGIIGFFIMLIILTLLRKDYFDKENNKAAIISILKMLSLIILFIVLLSLINGFI